MQIYLDGASFDPQSQTWVATQPDFDLGVIGDIAQFGTIYEVKLTATFFGLGPGSMTLTPVATSTIADPSTPPAPAFLRTGTGGHPVLPAHGIFSDVTMNHWDDYVLGEFALMDSPIGDFNGADPLPTSFPDWESPFSHDGQVGIESTSWAGVKALFH